MRYKRLVAASLAVMLLGGCVTPASLLPSSNLRSPAEVAQITPGQRDLMYMPPPPAPIPVAVYNFADQTGQMKLSDTTQSFSRAVTQGATSILIGALRDAGAGNWFTVIERERLDNVLRERQIIREMRSQYLKERETPPDVLPSLLFAGITLEGGIISYDTNTQTGGVGARFLGIGGSTQYRTNTATVYLRAVSVKTGEVLLNVVTQKKVSSVAISGGVFKFVKYDELLEGEVGVTANEPMQLAVQGAIERAVYALIMEGATPGPRQLWQFANAQEGQQWLSRYRKDRDRSLAASFEDGPPLPVERIQKN